MPVQPGDEQTARVPADRAQDDRARLVQALRMIERLQKTVKERSGPGRDEPVAVIGAGCRLPGGVHDPESFWRMLSDGVDATGPFPADRADASAVFDPDPDVPGKAYVVRGGFLDGPVDRFEPAVFGISPREAVGMDPQQRLTLEVAWEALERAGYAPDSLEGSATGVFLGVSTTDYVRLRQDVGDIDDVDAYQLIGEPSFMAGRISYTLGLMGPSQVVDTACSSSLVALHDACQALRLGECDMALAGGVNLMLAPYGFVLMSKFRALSADGRCKTFDSSADGYGRGEGAGVVVLKRLSDAQAAGDHILAVVRGTAVNHDGRSSGMTVPNPAAQQGVIRAALAAARIDPGEVGYVEAHGTGTSLGDPIELRALEAVVGKHREGRTPLQVGSVKTNIGHLESAAGVAGLIKLILSVQRAEIPPHLNFNDPNPNVDWGRLHIQVADTARPWPSDSADRVGGISSFGASGTNSHAVISQAPDTSADTAGRARRPWNVLTLSARTEGALRESAGQYADHLRDHPDTSLADLCFTTHVGRSRQARGLAVAADGVAGVETALRAFAAGERNPSFTATVLPNARGRKVAWMFTGQGSQRAGMARGLLAEPVFKDAFDRCAKLFDALLDRPLRTIVWPEPGEDSPIDDTRYTQPALFAVEYALSELWSSWGVRPSALIGHSIGEITAACVAGVFGLEDAVALVAARGRLMSALPAGGAMAALDCDEDTAVRAIAAVAGTAAGEAGGKVAIAGVNGPEETVVSGPAAEVAEVVARLSAQGVRGKNLVVSHAFHSPLIEPMFEDFRAVLSGLSYSAPRIPLISNVTGKLWTAAEVGPEYWVRHAAGAVRFRDGVRALHDEGFRTFLELGPVPILCGLGTLSVGDADAAFIPSLRKNAEDGQTVAQALGVLSLRGTRVDWTAFHAAEQARRIPLPTTPWNGEVYWFNPADPAAASAPAPGSAQNGDHPVQAGPGGLGRRLRGAVPAYEIALDDARWSALARPDATGTRRLPLGPMAEAALAAARDGLGGVWRSASDLRVYDAPALGAPERSELQVVVTPLGDGQAAFEVRGMTPSEERAGAPWRLIGDGVIGRQTASERLAAALDGRPDVSHNRYTRPLTPEGVALSTAIGDVVESAARSESGDAVLVTLVHGEHTWSDVVEAATAAVAWAAGTDDPPGATVVCALADLGCASPARVHSIRARILEDGGAAEFFDLDGAPLGGAHGVRLVPALKPGAAAEPWRDPAELLYRVEWHGAADTTGEAAVDFTGRGVLILADQGGLAEPLARRLRAAGAEVAVETAPLTAEGPDPVPDAAALGRLIDTWSAAAPEPSRVIILTGLDTPDPESATVAAMEEYAARADLLAVAVVQQLAERPACAETRVSFVTRGAMAADPAQSAHDPLANTLWGLGRVFALEHAEHWGGAVDLDPTASPADAAQAVEALASTAVEDQQAIRGGRRLVARLVADPPTPERLARQVPIRDDGTYLITGAFGGIGVALAHWLARAGAGRLVLTGRSGLPDRATWDGELSESARSRVEAVRSLERLGVTVDVVACDVTDEPALAALFRDLAADPRPLRGVIHAAGLSIPQFVRDVDQAEYRKVWRPKIIGGILLHRLSAGAQLDFFLGFSSIAATWGSQHLSSYSSANAFLDGLAHYRAAAGLPGLAVDWGPWAQESNLFGEDVMNFLKSTGLRPLAPPQCLKLLGSLLAGDDPQMVVCGADWAVYRSVMEARTDRPMLSTITIADAAGDEAGSAGLVDALLAAEPAGRGTLLLDFLREVLSEVLGVAADSLDAAADVMTYGLDSLMVMDVVRRCKRDLGVAVKASALFERTTLEEWTVLLGELFAAAHGEAAEAGADGAAGAAGDAAAPADGPTDPAWILRDVTLDPAIVPPGPARSAPNPAHVLLTGATGFLGAYLLDELLSQTTATVHCLVRCKEPAQGLARIRENLTQYLAWQDGADERIVVIPGDLGQARLGLSAERFAELAAQMDAIYHNGAWVNFSYTYDQLRPANLTGTEEILRLACLDRPIPVHYVSTYGIWGLPDDGRTVVLEDDDITGAGKLVTGYVQTKWAAEQLVMLARERGIPVNMYRPGRVLGDSRTGACLTTHFTTRVIKGCIQQGAAPELDLEIEMTPVDYVTGALVGISLLDRPLGGTYHLVNGGKMHFRELIDALQQRGWPLERIGVERWWADLQDSYGVRTNDLHPVMGVVEEFVVGGEEAIHYDVANAEGALAGTGIACPPLDRRLLDLYLDWMTGAGYLPAPGPPASLDSAAVPGSPAGASAVSTAPSTVSSSPATPAPISTIPTP
ncbi:MAG TPA: thioester reductase domain-containing protein [Actinocrinis sp.]|nr:thioester reductase domain-containing protein [Actinocrinis sp.]